MSNHNYSQYSKQNNEHKSRIEDELSTSLTETVVEESTPTPEVKMEPEVVNENVPEIPVIGVVANCAKLNVRAWASSAANVVCIIDAGSEVEIDVEKSNDEWFKVITAAAIEGYCMRKFVNADL